MPANDLTIYEDHGAEWWNSESPYFRSLLSVNQFRLDLLRQWYSIKRGETVVDIGCGGGLISVPLDQLGANVFGIDISPASLKTAKQHSSPAAVYLAADARSIPLPGAIADYVIIADVLDHIPDYDKVIAESARLLRPGGRLFITTLNRSWLSALLAVRLAEGLRLIPPGTHDPRLFIRPDELIAAGKHQGLGFERSIGSVPRMLRTALNWAICLRPSSSMQVFYAMSLIKEAA